MMAYQQGFVVSVIHNGKPVREFQGEDGIRSCILPFDSEYALRLKNNTGDTALVTVSIDSTPVVVGGELVLSPGGSVDLERFVNAHEVGGSGRRFKFVSLASPDVQDPTNAENGLVFVTFRPVRKLPRPRLQVDSLSKGVMRGATSVGAETFCGVATTSCCVAPGATVEGSRSDQEFAPSYDPFVPCGSPVGISLRLRGCPSRAASGAALWSMRDGKLCYNGSELQGYSSVMFNTDGDIVVTVKR